MWYGDLITLRGLELDDLKLTHKWVNTPEIVGFEAHPFPISMAEEQIWFDKRLKDDSRKVLIIETLSESRAIGYIYLDLNWRHRRAEITITIGELDTQGKGYGTDALRTAVRQAFNELGLNSVYATILDNNPASIRAFEKAGFKKEGIQRQTFFWQGRFRDSILVSILREEYQNQE